MFAQEDVDKFFTLQYSTAAMGPHRSLLLTSNIVVGLFLLTLVFWRQSITYASLTRQFLVEEIEFDLTDENEEMNLGGLDSFRKGMFKVPLYLVPLR